MNPILIAEKLTDIDDRYILESDPVTGVILKNRPHARPLSRFLNSGLGAAVISGAVALGVLIFVVLAGRVPPRDPARNAVRQHRPAACHGDGYG